MGMHMTQRTHNPCVCMNYRIAGIFGRRNFSPISPLASVGKNFILLCINDYTVDVATFTALAKIKSGKIFMQYTSALLVKFFSREIFPLYGNVLTYFI